MNKLIAFFVFLFLLTIGYVGRLVTVEPGNVGILVNLQGDEKGVSAHEVGSGRYWLTFNEKLYQFPTAVQNYSWTKSLDEGHPVDESITFNSVEGTAMSVDVGISFEIDPNKASLLFQKFRKGIDEITHLYLRNTVRNAIVEETSIMTADDLYGKGKIVVLKAVEKQVREQVSQLGINNVTLSWIGKIRLPPDMEQALNAKQVSLQMVQQRKNEIEQSKAEAQKEIEKAKGEGEAKLIAAQNEAEAIKVKGEALKNNPIVVQFKIVEKWNGELPKVQGGNTASMIDINSLTKSLDK